MEWKIIAGFNFGMGVGGNELMLPFETIAQESEIFGSTDLDGESHSGKEYPGHEGQDRGTGVLF
jgi:hypothetical protein